MNEQMKASLKDKIRKVLGWSNLVVSNGETGINWIYVSFDRELGEFDVTISGKPGNAYVKSDNEAYICVAIEDFGISDKEILDAGFIEDEGEFVPGEGCPYKDVAEFYHESELERSAKHINANIDGWAEELMDGIK